MWRVLCSKLLQLTAVGGSWSLLDELLVGGDILIASSLIVKAALPLLEVPHSSLLHAHANIGCVPQAMHAWCTGAPVQAWRRLRTASIIVWHTMLVALPRDMIGFALLAVLAPCTCAFGAHSG